MKHGTNSGYATGCRCKDCSSAHRVYARLPRTRERENARRREFRAANPEQVRSRDRARYQGKRRKQALAYLLKSKYGLSEEQFRSLLLLQDGKCAICRTDKPSGRGNWHVDHDHDTGKIRGLLCHHCNVGLGHFDDNAQLLIDAVLYLTGTGVQVESIVPKIEIADSA